MDRETRIAWLVDHAKRPRHAGALPDADISVPGGNPGCGDLITLYLKADPAEPRVAVVTFEGTNFAEVAQAFRESIDDYLAFCAERGEPPDRPYSGKIPLRVSPETHRRAAMCAEAEGLSLNQWIARQIETVSEG